MCSLIIEYFPDGGVHAYLPVRIGGTLETTELRLTMKNFLLMQRF